MIVRQEESTPIGDYFHDCGILKAFECLQNTVDEFEVETTELISCCDYLITNLKNLKNRITAVEKEWAKRKAQEEIGEKTRKGGVWE